MGNVAKRMDKIEQTINPDTGTRIFVVYDTDDPNLFELPNRPGEVFTREQIDQIQADLGLEIGQVIKVSYDDDIEPDDVL